MFLLTLALDQRDFCYESECLRRCQVIEQATEIAEDLVSAIVVQFIFELIYCADTLIRWQAIQGIARCSTPGKTDLFLCMLHIAALLVLYH